MVKTIGNNVGGSQWLVPFTSDDEKSQFVQFVGVAYYITRKIFRKYGGDREELLQVALLGVFKAIRNFDSSKGVKLVTVCFRYASQECLNLVRSNKSPAYSVRGDGKTSFIDLFCTLPSRATRFGYDLRVLRSQGIETIDSIPPKGVYVFFATEPHQEPKMADNWEEIVNADKSLETTEFVNKIVETLKVTPREAAIIALRLGGNATLEEVLKHPAWAGASKMGVLKAERRVREKLASAATQVGG